jgi:sporulation protein YlmC with PRC-barrel domain
MMKLVCTTAILTLLGVAALAQSPQGGMSSSTSTVTSAVPNPHTLSAIPPHSTTVSNYYKQDVYDPSNKKVGAVSDVLVDGQGKVTALIVGVGGLLGAGEKDIAIPFDSVRLNTENNKWRLVMNTTTDSLKNAPGYKYDQSSATWKPESK